VQPARLWLELFAQAPRRPLVALIVGANPRDYRMQTV
jgi:hypothetical protein